jgi:hypothetical protein
MSPVLAAARFRHFLNEPFRVLIFSLTLCSLYLLFNGNLLRLWGLHRDVTRLEMGIIESHQKSQLLDLQLIQAKDPLYMERQARDRLDFAGEHDLVFVFADQ